MATSEKNKPYSPVKTVLFTVLIFLFFLALLEVSGRVVLAVKNRSASSLLHGLTDSPRFQHIPGRGGFVPYYKGLPSRDARNPVNSLGFRGPELLPKRPGHLRVLCLGASTTHGDNLDYRDTYPALLQAQLDARKPGRYEVINGGQPGFDLRHINALAHHELPMLQPDIVLLLSINNNLKARNFWFVQVEAGERRTGSDMQSLQLFLIRTLHRASRYSALAVLVYDFITSGMRKYTAEFDWKKFAAALTADGNIWEADFRNNILQFLDIVAAYNPATRVVLLEQAVNTIDFPSLEPPFEKARAILREISGRHRNVRHLDLHTPVIEAAGRGAPVWQDPTLRDPLHLSGQGNEIVAAVVARLLTGEQGQQ